jgi:hypothetical protein
LLGVSNLSVIEAQIKRVSFGKRLNAKISALLLLFFLAVRAIEEWPRYSRNTSQN